MAKAGYCSECGRDVEVTPEGACPFGHGPECLSGVHEVLEPPAVTEEVASSPAAPPVEAPADDATGGPVYPEPASPSASPNNRAGLVVMIVVILLLLLACVLGGPVLYQAIRKTTGTKQTTASPQRAKIETTIGFMEAMLNNDALAIKPFLIDAAQNSVTETGWAAIASASTTGSATFSDPVWSGDTTAVVTFSTAEATGTLTFAMDPTKPDAVVMDGLSAAGAEHDVIGLVKAGAGWRALTLDYGAPEVVTFDAAFVKAMVP